MFLFLLGGSSDSDTEQNHTANSIMDRTDRPDSDALITTNDTTNAITSAPSTLTADGHLIQDQYWLLKSYRSQRRSFLNHHSNREYTVSPITLVPCDLATYQRTPKMHDQVRRICNVMSESFHGRRVNDEVELFAMEDGKETKGLRHDLERKGLTVRAFAAEGKIKFPSRSRVFQKEKPYLEKCSEALRTAVLRRQEGEKSCAVVGQEAMPMTMSCALLADPGGPDRPGKTRHLLGIVVDEEGVGRVMDAGQRFVEVRGVRVRVLGVWRERGVVWFVEEGVLRRFFGFAGSGVEVRWFCEAGETGEGKKAKRRRRRGIAASRVREGKEQEEEGRRKLSAKKEKEKEKKKAYQARRKARTKLPNTDAAKADEAGKEGEEVQRKDDAVDEGSLAATLSTLTTLTSEPWRLLLRHAAQQAMACGDDDGDDGRRVCSPEVLSETDKEEEEEFPAEEEAESLESGGGGDSGGGSGGLKVIHVSTVEEGKKAAETAGGEVYLTSDEDLALMTGGGH